MLTLCVLSAQNISCMRRHPEKAPYGLAVAFLILGAGGVLLLLAALIAHGGLDGGTVHELVLSVIPGWLLFPVAVKVR